MYLVSIDEKVLPLPMGININKFSNYFSDGILFIDYLDDEEKNKVLSDLFNNISILFCSYDLNKYDLKRKRLLEIILIMQDVWKSTLMKIICIVKVIVF